MSQSDLDSQAGSTAADSGWINGCMSEVLRSFFSYQVAVGSTMSEYRQVVDMRKSSVTSRSSLPSGPPPSACSRQSTSSGFAPARMSPSEPSSLPCRPCVVPSRCLRKYSWPLPEDPSRLERHTKRFLGKLAGLSGSSQDRRSLPSLSDFTA